MYKRNDRNRIRTIINETMAERGSGDSTRVFSSDSGFVTAGELLRLLNEVSRYDHLSALLVSPDFSSDNADRVLDDNVALAAALRDCLPLIKLLVRACEKASSTGETNSVLYWDALRMITSDDVEAECEWFRDLLDRATQQLGDVTLAK